MAERAPDPAEPADGPTTAATAVSPGSAPTPGPDADLRPEAGPSKPSAMEPDKGLLAFARELPVLIILAFVLALLIKSFLVQAFYIPSGSMEPTLMPGDRVLVNKVVYRLHDPRRGEVIVFQNPDPSQETDRGIVGGLFHWLSEGLGFSRPPDEDFIKRVIGLPGESVEIRNHTVFIDGRALDEPYLTRAAVASMADYGPTTVPQGKLFVMGDNRGNSNDSRASLGFIPIDKVVGKAFVIIWPPSRVGWLHGL